MISKEQCYSELRPFRHLHLSHLFYIFKCQGGFGERLDYLRQLVCSQLAGLKVVAGDNLSATFVWSKNVAQSTQAETPASPQAGPKLYLPVISR